MTQELMDFSPDLTSLDTVSGYTIEKRDHVKTNFDEIIGHIEDILMEDEFQTIQQQFLDKYWPIFEPIEENKLIYMDIFVEYNKAIESYIELSLKKLIPHFSMKQLVEELNKRKPELDGEVFEVLLTFTDFLAFKEMVLDYRAFKEGKIVDLSTGISITPVKIQFSEKESETNSST